MDRKRSSRNFSRISAVQREGVRQDFLALALWAEGPSVRPAQGNALGELLARWADNTGSTCPFTQGVALGWENRAPSGHSERCQEILPRPGRAAG